MQMIWCLSTHSLQHHLHKLTRTCEENGTSINVEKSKSAVVGRKPVQTDCVVQGKELQQVFDFSYSGTVIRQGGKLDRGTGEQNLQGWEDLYSAVQDYFQ